MTRYRGSEFHAFSDIDGFSMIDRQKASLAYEINNQTDDYLLNVNKEEYLQYLEEKYYLEPLVINHEEMYVSTSEEMIPGDMHPSSYMLTRGGSYPKDVIKYHIPFSGNPEYLKIRASSYLSYTPLITIEDGCVCFRIINFNFTADKIRQEAESNINNLLNSNSYLTQDFKSFNSSISQIASQTLDARRAHLLKKNDLLSSLGVPIKKSSSTPSTFSVPAKRTKAIASKPIVTEKGYKPEPTLDDSIYNQILKIIHDVGKQFERLPSTYSQKEEEHLRDHILLLLEPNFEGSTTGETFNKTGKTDILLRHENSNVFIAELKFWHGKKGFLSTISQLLGYLTWRDSKAAVVIFVNNKNFSSVLETAKEAITEHDNFLSFLREQEEGWYHYRFHIDGDRNREVKLALMLFHIPNDKNIL